MSIAGSVFLVAVGAILAYAINVDSDAFDINTIGVILMVAGVVGLLLSFAWAAYASRGRRSGGAYDEGYADRAYEEPPPRRPRR